MKQPFRTLCAALALTACLALPAFAQAPAAVPAPKEDKTVTDVTPLEDSMRNVIGYTTNFGGPYRFEQADHRSPAQAYGAEPAEGAVAVLRLYTRAEDHGNVPLNISGHSFISVRNVSGHDLEVGGLTIAPDTEMTFGTRGNRKEHSGIWYNLEGYYKYYLADAYYQNIHAIQVSLDQAQLDTANRNLASADHWSAVYNCAAFAAGMWNAVCSDTLSAGQPSTPAGLLADLMAKYADLTVYNPAISYDYIVYYGTGPTPSREFE